jgi:hypothetical protein
VLVLGIDVGLSGSFPEPERSGSPANAVLFRGEADGDIE